jgi:putative transposase
MVNYRRLKLDSDDAVYFLTMATKWRKPWFRQESELAIVMQTMDRIKARFNLDYEAWVTLPDHIHWLVSPNKADYSKVVFAFKRGIGAELKKTGKLHDGERIWQSRFWEHTILDDEDFQRCVEYIHYNPVKHGLVDTAIDWVYSSFREFVSAGLYPPDWGGGEVVLVPGAEYDL